MAKKGASTGRSLVARLPWVEAIATFLIGLLLYLPLHNRDLGKLTWALGAVLSLSRLNYELRLQRELEPVHKLAEVTDLTQHCSVDELRNLERTYLSITEPEFRPVKDHIIAEGRDNLLRLANDKTSAPLSAGEYYAWLLPILEQAPKGCHIRALSVMMESEWDDSPTEQRFLDASVAAANRGVIIDRVFVIEENQISKALQNKAIKLQTIEEKPTNFRGHLVKREYLRKQDPSLHSRLGDGFIIFDERVALIDIASPEGQARGEVTMNSGENARLIRLHDQLLLHSEPLSLTKSIKSIQGGNAP